MKFAARNTIHNYLRIFVIPTSLMTFDHNVSFMNFHYFSPVI